MNTTREKSGTKRSRADDGRNIVLIGMPGAGKSTVGVVLAKHMGYFFADSDLLIQEREGKLLHEIIDEEGLFGFQRVENEVNASIDVKRSVIATGGSVVYCEEAMEHLRKIGTVVYLSLPCGELAERLGDLNERGVAIREGQTLEALFAERAPLYERYADVVIDCSGQPIRQIVKQVREAVGHKKLEKNLIDLIKEEQAKLGYRKESLRLYYPLGTLNHFYGGRQSADGMQERLAGFSCAVKHTLGAVGISRRGERFCFEIPEQGSEYVHLNMKENEFILRLVELLGGHGATMGQIQALFESQQTPLVITPMDSEEFDVMIRFTEGDDPYYYCFKDEGCHIIYHRFLPEDYAEFGF